MTRALHVEDLRVRFGHGAAAREVVAGVDLSVDRGELVALVGSSGSGKSTTALAVARLHTDAHVAARRLEVDGVEVTTLAPPALRALRGRRVGLVFQDPHGALNPVFPALDQVVEAVRAHDDPGAEAGRARALALLGELGLGEATARRYPHQLSGGEKQRVVLAMAVAHAPALVVADEPTSALDAGHQAELLTLLARIGRERGAGTLLVTHDLALAARVADRVVVMDAGRVVEAGPAAAVFAAPSHPRTRALLAARDVVLPPRDARPAPPLLTVQGLTVELPGRGLGARPVRVLHGVDLQVAAGRTLALVGASGSGKSTLGRALLRLVEPTAGSIRFDGIDVRALTGEALRRFRRTAQVVFQDPTAALDPRLTVEQSLLLPMEAHALEPPGGRRARATHLLDEVGLDSAFLDRLPHTLSGGQRQRVALARALTLDPKLLICDEVLSALDAETQAQVLTLLAALQRRRQLAMIFVTHDAELVTKLADAVLELRAGCAVVPEIPPDPTKADTLPVPP